MENLKILSRFCARFFVGNFIILFFALSLVSYFINNYTSTFETNNDVIFAIKISAFLTLVFGYFFYRSLNQKENTAKKAYSNYTIQLNKSKEEFTTLLKEIITNGYFQEGEDYLKIYTYNFYSIKSLIFITFKNNEIFLTIRPVFSDQLLSNNSKEVRLIEAIAN